MGLEVRRPETEAKKSKKPKAGLRNIDKGLRGKLFLPTPDFGLPSLTTWFSLKILILEFP